MVRSFTILLVSMVLIAGFGKIAFSDDTNCEELMNTKCTGCHYSSRICVRLTKKSTRAWKRTVKNMNRHGAKISKDEAKSIVTCLSEPSPGVTAWCEKNE